MELPSVDLKITNPRLKELGALPKRATDGSAGYDIAACIDSKMVLFPGQTFDFDLGFAIAIPDPRWALFFIPRSGLGVKSGIILANGVGLIDSDYRGSCKISIWNRTPQGTEPHEIRPGDRIGQMVFMPVGLPVFNEVDEFDSETTRGEGGFGSTGITA